MNGSEVSRWVVYTVLVFLVLQNSLGLVWVGQFCTMNYEITTPPINIGLLHVHTDFIATYSCDNLLADDTNAHVYGHEVYEAM